MIDNDSFDDAIDRAVREMTHVSTDDRDEAVAVARVMARLREADVRRADARALFAPRFAWAGAAALVLMAIVVTSYLLRSPVPDARGPRIAKSAPAPSASPAPPSSASASAQAQPTERVREIPTRAAGAASTVRATTVARDARDARDEQLEPPLESDIEIASITPALLAEAPAIYVEPLITSSLQVDEIPVASIEMPPVSPERKEE